MPNIVIRFEPDQMTNPDLDIRYDLPMLLQEKSGGTIIDNGYDYGRSGEALLLFLKTADLSIAIPILLDFISNTTVLDNKLADCAIVAVTESEDLEDENSFHVVFPVNFCGGMTFK